MKTLGILGVALAGCAVGGGHASKLAAPEVSSATMPAAGPSNQLTIAGEPAHPAPGQLTAGVWDDNQNFDFFATYAARVAQGSPDLAAFDPQEQRAAHAAFATATAHSDLDIQLVLDTTGSMGDELGYLQRELDSISRQLHDRFPNVTPRWSVVLYKDVGDIYVTRPFDFTDDVARFQRDLAAQSAGGGGDFPEAVITAFEHGLLQHWRPDPRVAKLIFWVADAPPHPGEGSAFATLARKAQVMGVHVYPIASSGIDDSTEYQMRAAAQLTGGRYLFLTDDSHLGSGHAEPHIPCYAVTRLDQAVVRMIETELAGHRVPVEPDQIVRRVGSPNADGSCSVGTMQVVAF
jgi:hypothetical protein